MMSFVCKNVVRQLLVMLGLVASACAIGQSGETVLGQVDVGGRQVPLVAPTTKGIYENSKFVELPDGFKMAWLPGGVLSEPYRVQGGWSELTAWPALKLDTATVRHIKVVVATSAFTAVEGRQLRAVRAGMTNAEIADVNKALAQVKALLEVEAGGLVKIEYSLSYEQSPTVQVVRDGRELPIDTLISGEALAPLVNQSPFTTDDNSYWGPFSATVLIHSGTVVPSETQNFGRFGVVSYHDAKAKGQLAPAILAAMGIGESLVPQVTGNAILVPVRPETPILPSGPHRGVNLSIVNGERSLVAVPAVASWVKERLGDKARAALGLGGTVFRLSNQAESSLPVLLGLPDPGQSVSPDYDPHLSPAGDLTIRQVDDAEGKRTVIELPKANYSYGQLRVPVDVSKALGTADASLTFRIRAKGHDAWRVSVGDNSFVIADADGGFGRDVPTAELKFDGTWQSVSLPLSKTSRGDLFDRRTGQSEFVMTFADVGRADPAASTVEIADIDLVSDPSRSVKPQTWADPFADLRPTSGARTLTDAETARVVAALTGTDAVIATQAAWLCSQVKAPGAVTALLSQAQMADMGLVYAALSGLKFQDSPEGFAALKDVLNHGPFDTNRRLAYLVLADDIAKLTLKEVDALVVCRSWMGRVDGVHALTKINLEHRALQIITALQDEDPRVRAAVVDAAEVDDDLSARRLLYCAVNDPSEYVRVRSFEKLIFSKIDPVRTEALRSVRNESTTVALDILQVMGKSGKADFRPAVLLAVVDTRPEVRAAAVYALAALPGPIKTPEVQNLLADDDVEVQKALLRVAIDKKFDLPADLVSKLKASQDAEVAALATKLGGG